jgi:hypothetical protein
MRLKITPTAAGVIGLRVDDTKNGFRDRPNRAFDRKRTRMPTGGRSLLFQVGVLIDVDDSVAKYADRPPTHPAEPARLSHATPTPNSVSVDSGVRHTLNPTQLY